MTVIQLSRKGGGGFLSCYVPNVDENVLLAGGYLVCGVATHRYAASSLVSSATIACIPLCCRAPSSDISSRSPSTRPAPPFSAGA